MTTISQKISPFLWFDGQAEEAVNFYMSIFKNSKIGKIVRSPEGGPAPKGSAMVVPFEIEGMKFTALNGGPNFKFNEAVSFVINCDSQEEVDHYWDSLLAGGKAHACGWLKDKFGLSWQIVPAVVFEMMADPDPAKAARALHQVWSMVKLDIEPIRKAYEGK